MTPTLVRFLALLLIVDYAWSERNEAVCTLETMSNGLIPPPLPRNFEMQGEVANYVNKTLLFQEVYFDNVNLRAKLVLIADNHEEHYIFDYGVDQIIQYIKLHPGSSLKRDPMSEACIARPMATSPLRFVFGYRQGTKNARMYNSYQALRYGDEYQYAAKNKSNLVSRGLRTNVFGSCVYDAGWDATLNTTYYFTDENTSPSGGDPTVEGFLTAPVKITMNGTINVRPDHIQKSYSIQQSLSWFKKEPVFETNAFTIPQWLYCKNFEGSKEFPDLPTAFSVDLEVSSYTQDMDGQKITDEILVFYKIWYNAQKGIARRDFTPLRERDQEIYRKFQNLGPVTAIYDFNSGVKYTINKKSGRCYYDALSKTDFFATSKDPMHVRMASPEEMFYMDRDTLEFKGKDIMRDITCKVWAGKYNDTAINAIAYLETGISADAWHDSSSEFGIPVRHTVLTNLANNDGEMEQTVVQYNFFRFKSDPPRALLFDLHNTACIDTIERKYLGMTLSITKEDLDIIKNNRVYVLETVQYYMADITMVGTPLRIQAMRIEEIKGRNMITFALLEKTKLDTKVPATVLGVDLDTAISNLQDYVDSGRFLVKFINPQDDKEMAILAQPNGLVLFKSPLETFAEPQKVAETEFFTEVNEENPRNWYADDQPEPKRRVVKGMSGGALAGLAIAMLVIGIGVGIALMYLYIRKFNNPGLEDSYAMQSKR